MRLAWQPSFQSGSLEGYTDLMDQCAVTLAEVREGRGGEGPGHIEAPASHIWHLVQEH